MPDAAPFSGSDAQRLAKVMRQATRRARAIVENPSGSNTRNQALAAAQAAARIRDLERDLARLNVQANRVVAGGINERFAAGIRDADAQAERLGLNGPGAIIGGAFTGAETARAAILVRTATADIDKAFRSTLNATQRTVRRANAVGLNNAKIRLLLAGGAIDGQPGLASQRLRKEIGRLVNKDGFVEVPNKRTGEIITFKPDYYADMVFQTSMAEAYNIAELERLRAKGAYYVKIEGSNSTNFCTAFRGKVYYTGPGQDPLGTFPHIDSLPRGGAPFHPRCTKRYVAFNPRLATPTQIEAAKPTPNTERLHNKSPSEAQKAHEAPKPAVSPTPVGPPPSTPPAIAKIPATTPINPPIAPKASAPALPADLPLPAGVARTADDQFERDRSRPVQLRGSLADLDDVARELNVSASTAERIIHSAVPGTRGIFTKLSVSKKRPGQIAVNAEGDDGSSMDRTIGRDDGDKLFVHADLFEVARANRGGTGTSVFFEMARGLATVGVDRIETYAARSRYFNGYYTWPRLGYSTPLSALSREVRQALEAEEIETDQGMDLNDLMSHPAGREVWKRVGASTDMAFILRFGSKCWNTLLDYLRERSERDD